MWDFRRNFLPRLAALILVIVLTVTFLSKTSTSRRRRNSQTEFAKPLANGNAEQPPLRRHAKSARLSELLEQTIVNIRSDIHRVEASSGLKATKERLPFSDLFEPKLNVSECAVDFPSQTHQIPRQVFLMWKSDVLNEEARENDWKWRRQEPCFSRRVVDDEECSRLAHLIPRMQPAFDRLPLKVMRADTCRLLSVWAYGGVYMDLDVAPVKPFREWFNTSADIIVGTESEKPTARACNWFFAARPRHPCIRRSIQVIVEHLQDESNFNVKTQDRDVVLDLTGPAAFTKSLTGCAKFTMNSTELNTEKVHHMYASQHWARSSSYSSWIEEMSSYVGKHGIMFSRTDNTPEVYNFFMARSSELLALPADATVRKPLYAKGAFHHAEQFPGLPMHGNPRNAFDDSLLTYSYSGWPGQAKLSSTVVILRDLISLPVGGVREEGSLNCVRVINVQDGPVNEFEAAQVVVKNEVGVTVFESEPQWPANKGVFMVNVSVTKAGLRGKSLILQIKPRHRHRIRLAEVQVFTDVECLVPRKVEFPPLKIPKHAIYRILGMLLNAEQAAPCRNTAFIGERVDDDEQYALCLDTVRPGAAALISHSSRMRSLGVGLAQEGYAVHMLDPTAPRVSDNVSMVAGAVHVRVHKQRLLVNPASRGPFEISVSEFSALHGIDRFGVLALRDPDGMIFRMHNELELLAQLGKVDNLMIEFRVCGGDKALLPEESLAALSAFLEMLKKHFIRIAGTLQTWPETVEKPWTIPCVVRCSYMARRPSQP